MGPDSHSEVHHMNQQGHLFQAGKVTRKYRDREGEIHVGTPSGLGPDLGPDWALTLTLRCIT